MTKTNADFVQIFSTADQIESSLIVSMLQENGIEAVVMNKQDSAYVSIGEIQLYVAATDQDQAMALIDDLLRQTS